MPNSNDDRNMHRRVPILGEPELPRENGFDDAIWALLGAWLAFPPSLPVDEMAF